MNEVVTKQEDQAFHIIFNRPERMNAVNEALYQQTLDALNHADKDPEIRCVILSGNGRAFCAGADLKVHKSGERTRDEREAYIMLGQRVCERIQTMKTPVIAEVHGYALGGGAEIATSADFLIISEDAQLGFPEIAIGTYVGGGVTLRLPRLIGLRNAAKLLLLGDRITGAECLEIGLATEAPAAHQLKERTAALVERIVKNAPLSMARLKAAINLPQSPDKLFRAEAEDLLAIMETSDWAEGVAAFAERRSPRFEGR
ncbi:enoyl-CoA hydratase/isomerase family protein [Mesorhizobium sp. M7A.F.Ca.CA.001.07.2.1]|uniref:enoyl-CoA hydratase/isomerase family protein n=3 Tax=Phyllobacteriaceae TaxID=69277 RepID=UPI000FCA9956|nr:MULTISPECIES: enoyl-CoA hydratase/isomerase family protein [Mesorhizobium]RVB44375.1 enoyl-CoA hydratase/isomerase family protein [Mesorhizobium sp. M7A.F.Ca.CA.004.05.1.1]RWN88450.1 MAG: enoyl-CoA hydratase/isomerase family protein [Mesorhizobium sp.]MCF6127883.1 enoyl-CoA hydratase/isomerase family protein [Mesorhizobium ciceri]MCQ8818561.1 enoyl-CoA hydratase/isomerase family protein [Mesorhizobium sp. SEMIA396]RUU82165.1 enoyl-CoA hydratase/isomerase family protein [Mesorhizobium sp. M7